MGQANINRAVARERIFRTYRRCCWCGAANPDTIDHVPARVFFKERQGPEGYAFAACTECNSVTRKDEMVFSTLARCTNDPRTESEQKEIRNLLQGLKNNRPDVNREMLTGPGAGRIIPTRLPSGLIIPNRQVNLGPLVNACLSSYADKLIKGLYLKATGKVCASNIENRKVILSNGSVLMGEHQDIIGVGLPHQGQVKYHNRDLSNQFHWEYDFDEHRCALKAVFLSTFMIAAVAFERGTDPLSEILAS